MTQPTTNLLEEFERTIDLSPVSRGTRFANLFIDMIVIQALSYLAGVLIGIMAYSAGAFDGNNDLDGTGWDLLFTCAFLVIWLGYFTFMEYGANGRTLGKMATGTHAVREDGEKLTITNAFFRSLSRLIPFEPLSALGYRPWHDSITKTLVVKRQK